jgi:hypothetical protein
MNRALTRIPVVSFAGLALLVTACSNPQTGNPSPGSRTETTSTTTSAAAAKDPLADLKPCDLLTAAEIGSLGLTPPGSPEKLGGKELCEWKISGNGGLSAGAEQGISELNLDKAASSSINVGKYEAVLVKAPNRAAYLCTVAIEVTDSSSLVVIANLTASSTDTAAACERATKAAELIAPKLP